MPFFSSGMKFKGTAQDQLFFDLEITSVPKILGNSYNFTGKMAWESIGDVSNVKGTIEGEKFRIHEGTIPRDNVNLPVHYDGKVVKDEISGKLLEVDALGMDRHMGSFFISLP
eukprot:TRINITY_DN4159_c2_g1_i1.p1 TRINITY_DN4159_c2_g1~~TRINITY_DN4159_c2_g1_i1.p1  ORF type:complete len:113 (-),score=25.97 TRINITY_DN4159_c2_g1_i1:244-582(-)